MSCIVMNPPESKINKDRHPQIDSGLAIARRTRVAGEHRSVFVGLSSCQSWVATLHPGLEVYNRIVERSNRIAKSVDMEITWKSADSQPSSSCSFCLSTL